MPFRARPFPPDVLRSIVGDGSAAAVQSERTVSLAESLRTLEDAVVFLGGALGRLGVH